MSTKTARPGLAHIMRKKSAESWDNQVYDVSGEHIEGFRISRKIAGRRRLCNHFVPKKNVEAAEESLKFGIPPESWVSEELIPLDDSDM